MILVIPCKGAGDQLSCKSGNPQKASGRLLCEINYASLTNKCLTAPVVCTVPDPSPRPSALHDFFQYDPPHDEQGDINPYAYYL